MIPIETGELIFPISLKYVCPEIQGRTKSPVTFPMTEESANTSPYKYSVSKSFKRVSGNMLNVSAPTKFCPNTNLDAIARSQNSCHNLNISGNK